MRWRYHKDDTSDEVTDTFRQLGWSVLSLERAPEPGCPDLLVGGVRDGVRVCVLVEVKSDAGALEAHQEDWHAAWRGRPVEVARGRADVLRITGQGE
jgi:hypothetical protein